jgi:YggT family protein
MGGFLYSIISGVLELLVIAIFAQAILSWLIAFNVINNRHQFVRQVEYFLWAVTRPVLWPFRKVIPPLGAIDITPIIAILVLQAARTYLLPWLFTPIMRVLGG